MKQKHNFCDYEKCQYCFVCRSSTKKIVNNAHILYIIEKDTLGGGRVRDRDDGDDGDVSMECWKVLLFLYSKETRI